MPNARPETKALFKPLETMSRPELEKAVAQLRQMAREADRLANP